MLRKKRELWSGSPQDPIPKAYCLFKFLAFDLGVATLERRPRLWGIGGAGPDRCGIASSGRNLLRDRWLGVALWPPPFARSSAKRHGPYFELTYKANGKTVNVKLSPEAAPLYRAAAPRSQQR